MRMILLATLVTFTGVGSVASAVSPWAVVDAVRVKEAIAIAEFGWDEMERTFDVVPLGPGAFRAGAVEERDARTVRRIGRWLGDQDGHALVLIPLLDKTEAPAFDGIVLDRHRRIVANFVLRYQSSYTKDASKQMVWNYRSAARFADLDGWVFRLMGHAARLAHVNGEIPARLELTRAQSRAFETLIEESQTLVGTFTGDRPRPLWTLNLAPGSAKPRPEDVDRFKRLTTQNFGARVLLFHADDTVHDFCEGKLR